MHNFKELSVWRKSMDLAATIYKVTGQFPNDEKFGLISQMRRCCVSIASNIAEGAGRGSNTQFKYFLTISLGSAYELETQIMLSNDLCLISDTILKDLVKETTAIQKMLYTLQKNISNEKPERLTNQEDL